MSKTHRQQSSPKPKPRQIKRQKQQQAMQPRPLVYPQRVELVVFKPMG
jgi:hypothetical protein